MSEPIILGSEIPSADVLVYDKDVAYYEGNIIDDNDDVLLMEDNGIDYEMEFEFVSEA